MKVCFWGAVGTVTGSMHEVQVDGKRYVLDCGLYQGRRAEARKRNRSFPFDPKSIAGVVLSHAHIEHSRNLPTLVKHGYGGPIYATPAAADLCGSMLRDSAFIQEKDARFMSKRRNRRRRIHAPSPDPIEPLYTIEDAEAALQLFREIG